MTVPLRAVPDTGELPHDGPQTLSQALSLVSDLEDMVRGQEATIKSQAARIGRLERERDEDNDIERHPQRKEIIDLIGHWKSVTGHPRAKVSKDRIDIIRARLKDDYSIEHLRLAIDGIAAFPYVINGQRVPHGKPSQRHDALSIALKGGENLERFANLGAQARKEPV